MAAINWTWATTQVYKEQNKSHMNIFLHRKYFCGDKVIHAFEYIVLLSVNCSLCVYLVFGKWEIIAYCGIPACVQKDAYMFPRPSYIMISIDLFISSYAACWLLCKNMVTWDLAKLCSSKSIVTCLLCNSRVGFLDSWFIKVFIFKQIKHIVMKT